MQYNMERQLSQTVLGKDAVATMAEAIEARIERRSSSNGGNFGVLVEANSGGGKTVLLRSLGDNCCSTFSTYVDLEKILIGDTATDVSSISDLSLALQKKCIKHILLLDNIDYLSMSSQIVASVLIEMMSQFTNKNINTKTVRFIVATCTKKVNVPGELLYPSRFSSPIVFPYPSTSDRTELFTKLLSDPNLVLDFHSSGESERKRNVRELSASLSYQTQGCSVGDILKLMKNIVFQNMNDDFSMEIKISSRQLLREAGAIRPISTSDSSIQVRNISSDTEPFVVGLQDEKDRLKDVLENILDDDKNESGQDQDQEWSMPDENCPGVLIHGPSGCGKSLLVSWIAHQVKGRFKFLSLPCADLVHKEVGASEREIIKCFEKARSMAPCILLLDNLDIVFGTDNWASPQSEEGDDLDYNENDDDFTTKRSSHPALDRILSALLIELDGISKTASNSSENSVLVIATTMNAQSIDSALKRPGRLEEHIEVKLPVLDERKKLLSHLLNEQISRHAAKTDQSSTVFSANDDLLSLLAHKTKGKTHAAITLIVQEANMFALNEVVTLHEHEKNKSDGDIRRGKDLGDVASKAALEYLSTYVNELKNL
mgnify:CR=1 FL=1